MQSINFNTHDALSVNFTNVNASFSKRQLKISTPNYQVKSEFLQCFFSNIAFPKNYTKDNEKQNKKINS